MVQLFPEELYSDVLDFTSSIEGKHWIKKILNSVLKKKHLIMWQKENFVSSLESDSEIENIEGCRQTNYQGMKTPSQPYNEEGLNLDN